MAGTPLLVLVAGLVLLGPPRTSAEERPVLVLSPVMTIADLVEQIDALDRLAAVARNEEELQLVLGSVPDTWRVQDDGREHVVRIGELVRQSIAGHAGWEARRDALRFRLATLRALVDHADAAGAPTLAAARDELAAVLALPEFRPPGPNWVARLVARIREWIRSWLPGVPPVRAGVEMLGELLGWLVGIAAMALLIRALLRRRHRLTVVTAGPDVPREPWHVWLDRCRRALAEGETREAVRCAYMAVLLRFEEQGVWDVDESRTPREYTRLVPPDDRRRDPFVALVRQFEETWYGKRPADAAALTMQLEGCGCSGFGAMPAS